MRHYLLALALLSPIPAWGADIFLLDGVGSFENGQISLDVRQGTTELVATGTVNSLHMEAGNGLLLVHSVFTVTGGQLVMDGVTTPAAGSTFFWDALGNQPGMSVVGGSWPGAASITGLVGSQGVLMAGSGLILAAADGRNMTQQVVFGGGLTQQPVLGTVPGINNQPVVANPEPGSLLLLGTGLLWPLKRAFIKT